VRPFLKTNLKIGLPYDAAVPPQGSCPESRVLKRIRALKFPTAWSPVAHVEGFINGKHFPMVQCHSALKRKEILMAWA
jgi:hypothetical protein